MLKNPLANFVITLLGRVLENLIIIVFSAVAARMLGQETFGQFVYGISVAMFLNVFPDLGLSTFIVREIAKDKNTGIQLFGRLFFPRLMALCILLLLTYFASFFFWHAADLRQTVLYLTFAYGLFSLSDFFLDLFRGNEEMHWPALLSVSFKLTASLLGIVALWKGYGLYGVLHAYIVAGVCLLIFSIFLTQKIHGKIPMQMKWHLPKSIIAECLPFAVPRIIGILNTRLGLYLLPFFSSMADVGVFGASLRLVEGVLFIPALIGASTFPNFVRLNHSSGASLATGANATFKLLLAIVLPIALGCQLFAEPIIRLIYGDAYFQAAPLLTIHIWMCVFFFGNSLFATVLQAVYRQKTLVFLASTSLAIHAICAFTLIPHFGNIGAAYAALFPEIIMLVVCMSLYSRYLRLQKLLPGVMKVMAAALIVSLAFWIFRHLSIIPLLAFGVASYLLLLAALKPLESSEILWIKTSVKTAKRRDADRTDPSR